jgi:transcriptional regulator with XRE-family HTH domain
LTNYSLFENLFFCQLRVLKKQKNHIGEKLKRLRAYRGMTQEELARAIGKTRSLVSYFERTGSVNKFTLQEIAAVLKTKPEELESLDPESQDMVQEDDRETYENGELFKSLIEQQRAEIEFLRETINQQWSLLNGNTKSETRS